MPPTRLVTSAGPPLRKLLILTGLVVLLVGVLAGTYALLKSPATSTLVAQATAAPSPLPTFALTLGTPTPIDADGWISHAPCCAFNSVAFAQSQPTTGYACGSRDVDAPSGYGFGVTADGGETWKTLPSPQKFNGCSLVVSATNPHAIALVSEYCFICSGDSPPPEFYYSIDDGAHWTHGAVPPGSSFPGVPNIINAAWIGSDLYSFVQLDRAHAVMVSHAGSAFQWFDLSSLYAGVAANVNMQALQTYGSHLVALLAAAPCSANQNPCALIATSNDQGATWTTTPIAPGANVIGLMPTPFGAPLLGAQGIQQAGVSFIRSFDQGRAWQTLPTMPNGFAPVIGPQTSFIFETADGTLYAAATTELGNPKASYEVFRLQAGATAWVMVTHMPRDDQNVYLADVTYDAQGHPLALWCAGTAEGLYSHTP